MDDADVFVTDLLQGEIIFLSPEFIWNNATEAVTLPFHRSWIAASLLQTSKEKEKKGMKREISSTTHFQLLVTLCCKKYNNAAGKKLLDAVSILLLPC